MSKFKTITHVLAAAAAVVAGFLVSPAGQALVKQYPVLAPIVLVLGALGLYHNPKA